MLAIGLERRCRIGLDGHALETGEDGRIEAFDERTSQDRSREDLCGSMNLQIPGYHSRKTVDWTLRDVQRDTPEVGVGVVDLCERGDTVDAFAVDDDAEIRRTPAPISNKCRDG